MAVNDRRRNHQVSFVSENLHKFLNVNCLNSCLACFCVKFDSSSSRASSRFKSSLQGAQWQVSLLLETKENYPKWQLVITRCQSLYHSLSFFVFHCRSLYYSLRLVASSGHSLSFDVPLLRYRTFVKISSITRSSRPKVFCGKAVAKFFGKVTGKHPWWRAVILVLKQHSNVYVFL